MKKWIKFFGLSFFSHQRAREGAKHGYANVFLSFALALVLLWAAFVGSNMLPFGAHYGNSPDFMATVRSVFAVTDNSKGIKAEIADGTLFVKDENGKPHSGVLVNTFENDHHRESYSVNGFNIVVDTRPANSLAEVEAYCLSNDGNETKISYEEYLTLSQVARLNFDFKLRYTGDELKLGDESVLEYRAYLDTLNGEATEAAKQLDYDLSQSKITKEEYNRAVYELYFVNYYPAITGYEGVSAVPLLRNYYSHEYLSKGIKNYLFVFDDYMTGSFETSGGVGVMFHGFYSDLADGPLVKEGADEAEANMAADQFVKKSFYALLPLNLYAYGVNTVTLLPFLALMLLVAALLTYSILKLKGVESISSLGGMVKISGAFCWVCGGVAALVSLMASFFTGGGIISILPIVSFFVTLVARSLIFALQELGFYRKELEKQAVIQREE